MVFIHSYSINFIYKLIKKWVRADLPRLSDNIVVAALLLGRQQTEWGLVYFGNLIIIN